MDSYFDQSLGLQNDKENGQNQNLDVSIAEREQKKEIEELTE